MKSGLDSRGVRAKRKRAAAVVVDEYNSTTAEKEDKEFIVDPRLYEIQFPKDIEGEFAAAIFEIGLKHASPKVLMGLMPTYESLTTEHIKSHLQKYRIHNERSKEEFLQFYNAHLRAPFLEFESGKGWEKPGKQRFDSTKNAPARGNGSSNHELVSSMDFPSDAENHIYKWCALFEDVLAQHGRVRKEMRSCFDGVDLDMMDASDQQAAKASD